MSTNHRELPERPNLEQYKNQARDLVRAVEQGDAAARLRVARWIPEHGAHAALHLTDAQRLLALEHGFPSWPRFREHLTAIAESRLARKDRIQAIDGPFSGMKGVVEEILPTRSEVRAIMDVRGRKIAVWFRHSEVKRS